MSGPRRLALVVDDEAQLAALVRSYLEREGFEVELAGDGESAVRVARDRGPDVIVLDLMLPGIDGIEACRQIRAFSDAYILMLTAKAEEVDKIVGLSTGADDYVTKPFSPGELVARIRALMRRPRRDVAPLEVRRFGDLEVDPLAREVRKGGTPVELTRLGRENIERVWGPWFGDEHVVDVHVANLRRKLGDDARTGRYVRTVRGVGYRMATGT